MADPLSRIALDGQTSDRIPAVEVEKMLRKQIITLLAVAFLTVGLTSFLMGQATPTSVKQASTNPQAAGRYQIFMNPNVRADTLLLDTQTGKTWVQTGITNVKGEPTIWMYREHVDNE